MSEINLDDIDLDGALFDDSLEIDEIPDNPNHLPDDVYTCQVMNAELKLTANKDKVGITLKYQIVDGPYSTAFPFTEWLWVPRAKKDPETGKLIPFTVDEQRANSRLKKHFIAAGFGADEMKGKGAKDFLGKFMKVRTRNKKDNNGMDRPNVVDVMPINEGSEEGMDIFGKAAEDV